MYTNLINILQPAGLTRGKLYPGIGIGYVFKPLIFTFLYDILGYINTGVLTLYLGLERGCRYV